MIQSPNARDIRTRFVIIFGSTKERPQVHTFLRALCTRVAKTTLYGLSQVRGVSIPLGRGGGGRKMRRREKSAKSHTVNDDKRTGVTGVPERVRWRYCADTCCGVFAAPSETGG